MVSSPFSILVTHIKKRILSYFLLTLIRSKKRKPYTQSLIHDST